MKRLVMDGSVLAVRREIDKCYCYTLNPSPIHHKSNKIEHYLKIVDAFIELKQPEQCLIEQPFGCYIPDLFYKDHFNRSVAAEVQLTKISAKKMQNKINHFIKEYGKTHDARLLIVFTDYSYHLSYPKEFKVIQQSVPKSPSF